MKPLRPPLALAEDWARRRPPARPSAGDIAQYESALRTRRGGNSDETCLILGCTPELRSLAHRRGMRVVCADGDAAMFEAMTTMVDPRGREEFLCTNWLDLDGERRFDAALGDGSVNMVSTERHPDLLAAVARVTKAGAIAALRVHLRTPPPFSSVEEVVAWYRREGSGKPFYSTVRTPLYMLLLQERNANTIDTREIHAYLGALQAKGVITQAELDSHPPGSVTLSFTSADAFLRAASPWFALDQTRHGADYGFPENHPIFVLRRSA